MKLMIRLAASDRGLNRCVKATPAVSVTRLSCIPGMLKKSMSGSSGIMSTVFCLCGMNAMPFSGTVPFVWQPGWGRPQDKTSDLLDKRGFSSRRAVAKRPRTFKLLDFNQKANKQSVPSHNGAV